MNLVRMACWAASLALGASAAEAQGTMESRSAAIAHTYLRVWSSGSAAAVTNVPYIYGPSVRFYGRTYGQRALMAEKSRFMRRWPIRSYAHRPGSMQVVCNAGTRKCAVRSLVDWRVSDPARRASSQGASSFDLGISFAGDRPVVLYESGAVLAKR